MTRPCPACGDERATLLHRDQFAPIVGLSEPEPWDVVSCEGCGMCFVRNAPAQPDLSAYYANASKYRKATPGDRLRLPGTADRIAAEFPNLGTRILDVGCGSGLLGHLLIERGYESVTGVEPSGDGQEFPLRRVERSLSAFAGQRFDLAVLCGVLEHVVDVGAFVKELKPLASTLYLEVPNVRGWLEHPTAPFQEFSTEHVNFFSPDSLTRTLGRSGFRVTHWEEGAVIQTPTQRAANLIAWAVPSSGDDVLVREYVGRSAQQLRQMEFGSGPCVVWGCGTLTRRVWKVLSERRDVRAVTDSNPVYHGHKIGTVPIVHPVDAMRKGFPVVIVSSGQSEEIRKAVLALNPGAVIEVVQVGVCAS